ncbi:MAG: hypothetical protein U0527_04355 [Candidatus Eisenbacteria bacterium]
MAGLLSGPAQAYQPIDRTLPDYRSAVYSFHEAYPDTLAQDTLAYATVEHFAQLYPDTLWAGWLRRGLTNEDGSLAWRRSHDMMALLVLYQATGDVERLERCWHFSVAAMAVRDDLVGKQDFLGRSRPVWGTTRYGSGRRTTFLVHTALILEPLLTTLAILDGKLPEMPPPPADAPIWREATPERRAELLARALESLDIFEEQWRPGPGEDEGLYVALREEESREDTPEPFNRQNLMAWDFYLAYALTGDEARMDRAKRLARFFKNRLELTPDDAYLWDYEPIRWEHKHAEEKLPVSVCDDISHGWIAIEPVPELVRAGVVFDDRDLARFAHTLTRSIYQGDGVFFAKVGCSASFNKVLVDAVPGWLCLADGDPSLLPMVRRFMFRHVAAPQALHLAYLIALETRK